MVSGAEEMWTDRVQCDWWWSCSNECIPTHQDWQELEVEASVPIHKKVGKKRLVWVMSIGRNRLGQTGGA